MRGSEPGGLQAALNLPPGGTGRGTEATGQSRLRGPGAWAAGSRAVEKGVDRRGGVIRWDGSSSFFPPPAFLLCLHPGHPEPCLEGRGEGPPRFPRELVSGLSFLPTTSLPAPSRLCSRVPRSEHRAPATRLRLWGQLTPVPPPSRPTSVGL